MKRVMLLMLFVVLVLLMATAIDNANATVDTPSTSSMAPTLDAVSFEGATEIDVGFRDPCGAATVEPLNYDFCATMDLSRPVTNYGYPGRLNDHVYEICGTEGNHGASNGPGSLLRDHAPV